MYRLYNATPGTAEIMRKIREAILDAMEKPSMY